MNLVCDGRYDLAVTRSWKYGTVKRVVRSTLSAEGYAISEAGEQAEWIKQCLEEIQLEPGVKSSEMER